jgi:hypothetical protein
LTCAKTCAYHPGEVDKMSRDAAPPHKFKVQHPLIMCFALDLEGSNKPGRRKHIADTLNWAESSSVGAGEVRIMQVEQKQAHTDIYIGVRGS